jgi:hypothetical protein
MRPTDIKVHELYLQKCGSLNIDLKSGTSRDIKEYFGTQNSKTGVESY